MLKQLVSLNHTTITQVYVLNILQNNNCTEFCLNLKKIKVNEKTPSTFNTLLKLNVNY